MINSRAMSPREASRRLGVRLDAVYSAIWCGRLKARKVDGRWLVDGDAIEARLAQRTKRRKMNAV